MRLTKIRHLLLFFMLFLSQHTFALNVPFINFTLNPNQQVNAAYSFGNYHMIFCYANTQQPNIGSVTWQYAGNSFTTLLPTTLVTNTFYTGQLINSNGTITLANTASYAIQVSCQYGY